MQTTQKHHRPAQTKQITILSHHDISLFNTLETKSHPALPKFLSDNSDLTVNHLSLQANEIQKSPANNNQRTMLIFHQGKGKLTTDKEKTIVEGDVVIIPANYPYTLSSTENGLQALVLSISEDAYSQHFMLEQNQSVVEELLFHNQARLQQLLQKPFFTMLQDGSLQDSQRWQIFLECMHVWVEHHQTPLHSLQENLKNNSSNHYFDPILEAIVEWFTHQMLVLDHLEKAAIIHLVIESVSNAYHEIVKPHFPKLIYEEYFNEHLKVDIKNTNLDETLFYRQSSATLLRIREIIDQAWDMLDAMMNHIYVITTNTSTSNYRENERL